jgi:hypothetical protein
MKDLSENTEKTTAAAQWPLGRRLGAKRAFQPKQVWAIRFWLNREGRLRDRALYDLAIDSKLRGCDLVKIRIAEVSAAGNRSAERPSSSRKPAVRYNSKFSTPPCQYPGMDEKARWNR